MDNFSDKTIVITGASRGIGAATARYLAARGGQVVLAARNKDAIDNIARDIQSLGGTAHTKQCDVSRYEDVEALMRFTKEKAGAVDILINNAGGIDPIARIADSEPEAWSRVVDANYKGVYYGLRAAIPLMLEQKKRGIIINISSGAATSALEGWSHYCSSKAAVLSLTRCAHREYSEQGIRVVGLSPGTVATDMQNLIRASGLNPVSQLDPKAHIPSEWVARAIAFLCTEEAAEFAGGDFSLKNNEGRARVGLPLLTD